MSFQLARWVGVASDSRQDHASGTLITRPSAKCAVMVLVDTTTRLILASVTTAVLMPSLDDARFILADYAPNIVQFSFLETSVPGHA
jgi:hypothetical protein